ncbi:MAG: EF-Tu/IF-2/RF-3 family GTPase, partial [Clostridia bacterium]|nr:EF-Tu/IF-2/RF-3 family GTPase [Clostridia bacterium]
EDLTSLFETILDYIQAPEGDCDGPLQMLVSSIDYNEYVGRFAIGRIERGRITTNQEVMLCDYHRSDLRTKSKVTAVYQFDGLKRTAVDTAYVGDIVSISGIENVNIGNTICANEKAEPIPFVKISEPTVEMTFCVNDSPFAGREGKFITSRQLRERLFKELLKDVSIRVEETESPDAFRVLGRGEMHLSILIETMRREGYEFQVSTPKVIYKTINDQLCEPYERLVIDVPSESIGSVMEKMGYRKGELQQMTQQGNRMRLEFIIPSRGLFGYRGEFMTDTRGEGILNAVFYEYGPMKGEITKRNYGSLISFDTGVAVTYGLYNAQERGNLFIGAGVPVYAGMVVGSSPKAGDIAVNVCKKKHVTNTRSSSSDEALRLTPPRILSLEQSLEYIADDELLEITPESTRIRKRILDHTKRARAHKN